VKLSDEAGASGAKCRPRGESSRTEDGSRQQQVDDSLAGPERHDSSIAGPHPPGSKNLPNEL